MNKRYKYPPKIEPDGSLLFEKTSVRWPKVNPGFSRDKENPWRLVNEWQSCEHRQTKMSERPCGLPLIVMSCQCQECPLYGRTLKPEDCDFCDYSDSGSSNKNAPSG